MSLLERIKCPDNVDRHGVFMLTASGRGRLFIDNLVRKGFRVKGKRVQYNKYSVMHLACGSGSMKYYGYHDGVAPPDLPETLQLLIDAGASALAKARRSVLPIDILTNQINWVCRVQPFHSLYSDTLHNFKFISLESILPYSVEMHKSIFVDSFKILIRQMRKESSTAVNFSPHIHSLVNACCDPLFKLPQKTRLHEGLYMESDPELDMVLDTIAQPIYIIKEVFQLYIEEIELGNICSSTKQSMIDLYIGKPLEWYSMNNYAPRVHYHLVGILTLLLTHGYFPSTYSIFHLYENIYLQPHVIWPFFEMILNSDCHCDYSKNAWEYISTLEYKQNNTTDMKRRICEFKLKMVEYHNIKSLKHNCRLAVYRGVNDKDVAKHCDNLGLPVFLQHYLLDLEH